MLPFRVKIVLSFCVYKKNICELFCAIVNRTIIISVETLLNIDVSYDVVEQTVEAYF